MTAEKMIWFLYGLIFFLGLALGSYLNSWVWSRFRQPAIGPGLRRSRCVHCGRTLVWFENIPLGSFLLLSGRCRTCRRPIPFDYFLVELAAGLLFVGIAYYHLHLGAFTPWHFFRDLFFAALLTVVFVCDWKHYIILPGVVLSGAIIAVFINYWHLAFSIRHLAFGIIVGGGFFLLQHLISKGRWIGRGDIYLGVMMGAFLGWPVILAALFAAYILGALAAVLLLVFKKKNLGSEVPFGTFLATGTMLAMFWGEPAVRWYAGLIG